MRARILKPGFFRNEDLASLSCQHRLLFAAMLCMADREGRIKFRPRCIKIDAFPFDGDVDVRAITNLVWDLHRTGMVKVYSLGNEQFIHVVNFLKHQHVNIREAQSTLPSPDDSASNDAVVPEECIKIDAFSCASPPEAEAEAEAEQYIHQNGASRKPSAGPATRCPKAIALPWFEAFWAAYPRKKCKDAARRKFETRVKDEDTFSAIMTALNTQLPDMLKGDPKYIPHPATWLNAGQWQDEPDLFKEEQTSSWPPPGAIMGNW